ncbi:MAG: autotransporter domain-containing protein, partial [Rhodospirillales bacterium]|nr:autotransporter domain-containing protein [Rhodospirillales bacterium]
AGGRIGGQFDVGAAKMAVYVGANYVHEFKGEDNVTFTSGGQTLSFANDRLRDYGEATLGITIAQSEAISGFIEGNYIRSFNKDAGNLGIDGAGGRAGIRIKF